MLLYVATFFLPQKFLSALRKVGKIVYNLVLSEY